MLAAGQGTTFWHDEWNFVLTRRDGLEGLLRPLNGHLSIVPVLVYKALFASVGMTDYLAYRVTALGVHTTCGLLVFAYARKRLADLAAVVVSLSLLLLFTCWSVLLIPILMNFTLSLAAGIGVLILFDRGGRSASAGSSALLLLAVASSAIGVPILVGVAVELAWARRWGRLVVVVPSALLVVGFYLLNLSSSSSSSGNLVRLPDFAAAAASAALGALVGGYGSKLERGRLLLGLLSGLTLAHLWRSRSLEPRLLGIAATAASYWGLTGLARAHVNILNWYLYPGAVLLLLFAVEVMKDLRLPRFVVALLPCVLGLAVFSSHPTLSAEASILQQTSDHVQAELRAVEVARASVDRDFRLDPGRLYWIGDGAGAGQYAELDVVAAGPYLDAVDDLGSPAHTDRELLDRPEGVQGTADFTLVAALGLELERGDEFGCRAPDPLDIGDQGSLEIHPPARLLFTATDERRGGLTVRIRRFASGYQPLDSSDPSMHALELPDDESELPWHLLLPEGISAARCAG